MVIYSNRHRLCCENEVFAFVERCIRWWRDHICLGSICIIRLSWRWRWWSWRTSWCWWRWIVHIFTRISVWIYMHKWAWSSIHAVKWWGYLVLNINLMVRIIDRGWMRVFKNHRRVWRISNCNIITCWIWLNMIRLLRSLNIIGIQRNSINSFIFYNMILNKKKRICNIT